MTPPSRLADHPRAQALYDRFAAADQAHVFGLWDALEPGERDALIAALEPIDLDRVAELRKLIDQPPHEALTGYRPPQIVERAATPPAERVEPIRAGRDALKTGKIAALTVAGGQASRLGLDIPKGCVEFGPVTGRTLFELFARQIGAAGTRYGARLPWLIMTSPANHAATTDFFAANDFFGLPHDDVHFFSQGTLPALDDAGRICMASRTAPFMSPDGHGGIYRALHAAGLLPLLAERGVEHVSYFQVDNPQIRIADPWLLGLHIGGGAEYSSKVTIKTDPGEKVGVFVRRADGHIALLEYSDLSPEVQAQRDADGRLSYRAGNPAIHALSLPFLDRIARDTSNATLPFHRAHKAVPHLNADALAEGREEPVAADGPNAYKFEQFVFDAISAANGSILLEADRDAEFLPIKSKEGPTSIEAVQRDYQRYWAAAIAATGGKVETDADGNPTSPLEVDPRFNLDGDDHAQLSQWIAARGDGPAAGLIA
jgi:UDP-N-acetylglucosamine/UDP-N-acetylgalactosamine diphosphorylase